MAGNVSQWVEDGYHDSYKDAPDYGSAWIEGGDNRTVRSGSWEDSPDSLRAANRSLNVADFRIN
jgi:formylglycine-generating enzyme required for sulfatase activity